MSEAQAVYDIMEIIDMPSEEEDVFFPNSRRINGFYKDYERRGFVARLDHMQSTLMGQEISERTGESYTLLPLRISYEKAKSDEEFRKMLRGFSIPNQEVILKEGSIIPRPYVKEIDGKLVYEGSSIPVKLRPDVFSTLRDARLIKNTGDRVYKESICFDNGKSAIGSYWNSGNDCFAAGANPPSYKVNLRIAAFVKNDRGVSN